MNYSSLVGFATGGDEGNRTLYLLNAIQALSQVSYAPVMNFFQVWSLELEQRIDLNLDGLGCYIKYAEIVLRLSST